MRSANSSCAPTTQTTISDQLTKLRAPLFSTADLIFHVDSDCVFNKPFGPHCLIVDGLPVLYHREYDFFYRIGQRLPWQGGTSYLCRQQIDNEFMSLFPLVYPRRIYGELERWFEGVNGFSYEDLDKKLNIVAEFSEFNLLGAFSYLHGGENPYHKHLNWGESPATHYLDQLCQDGNPDRSIADAERERLETLLDDGKAFSVLPSR